MSETTEALIERVLAEHEYATGLRRGSICVCAFVPSVDPSSGATQQDYHRAHVAAAIAEALAEWLAAQRDDIERAIDSPPITEENKNDLSHGPEADAVLDLLTRRTR